MNPGAPTTDTIAAIATPVGAGGIGVVRISGPESLWIARRLTRRSRDPKPRYAHLVRIFDGNNDLIDQALLLFMPGPRSYTGEDVAELSCHGGSVAIRRVLDSALAAGARPAGPGEFTLRAFLNGRLDLAQAEAVADLVAAPTPAALAVAANQLAGRLSDAVGDMRSACLDLLAQMEAEVDFDEDEVPPMDRALLASTPSTRCHERLEDALATAGRGIMQRHGVRVALVGSPNVGKSSLMNALLSTDRAIVTEIPGTTRDVLEESFDLDGIPIVLNDTAGLRDTRDPCRDPWASNEAPALSKAPMPSFSCSTPAAHSSATTRLPPPASARAAKPTIVALNKRDLPHAVRATDVSDLVPPTPPSSTPPPSARMSTSYAKPFATSSAWPVPTAVSRSWPASAIRKPSPAPATSSPPPVAPWPTTSRPTSSASASAAPSTPSAKSPANPPPKTCSTSSSPSSASASKPQPLGLVSAQHYRAGWPVIRQPRMPQKVPANQRVERHALRGELDTRKMPGNHPVQARNIDLGVIRGDLAAPQDTGHA